MRDRASIAFQLQLGLALLAVSFPADPARAQGASTNLPPIVYHAPAKSRFNGTGLTRPASAGTRGADIHQGAIVALAPQTIGLTGRDLPILWWHASQGCTGAVEFCLNALPTPPARGLPRTVAKAEVANSPTAGYHTIDLSQLPSPDTWRLVPGKVYEWTIRLKAGPEVDQHATSGGLVGFRALDPDLTQKLALPGIDAAASYASDGYWYDAVDQLASHTNTHPRLRLLLKAEKLKLPEFSN